MQRNLPEGKTQANQPAIGKQPMEHFPAFFAALPISLILVIGSVWWIFRR